MKANSQYYRYLADLDARKASAAQTLCSVKHVVSCKGSMQAMAGSYDNEIHVSINGADFYFSLIDLNRHPNSLLGHPSKRSPYFNPTTGSYFFPRNQDIFPSIHQYYRCPGKPIRRPPFISMQRFVEEIEFFQLRPQVRIIMPFNLVFFGFIHSFLKFNSTESWTCMVCEVSKAAYFSCILGCDWLFRIWRNPARWWETAEDISLPVLAPDPGTSKIQLPFLWHYDSVHDDDRVLHHHGHSRVHSKFTKPFLLHSSFSS